MRDSISPERLELPLYSYADADYLAQLTRGTARRWLSGYEYRKPATGFVIRRPPVTPASEWVGPKQYGVSFLELIELVAIGGLKGLGFSLLDIREVVTNCQELFHSKHPLAMHDFKVGGRDVFVQTSGGLAEVLRKKGQQAWYEVLSPFLATLEYEGPLARRWWPAEAKGMVVVDPDYGFGFPVIKNSGVRTEIILERFQAGDFRDQIAEDFNITSNEVEYALQFEVSRLKPAA
ncbi:MAG: DUF433 domain-containing protein [Dehalococcoidia bacterium]